MAEIINLPDDLLKEIENMAKHVHETWTKGRIKDGWQYGIERNDELKEHPSLVSYDELSESEKEYDRRTVMATLSYLTKNGYEIRKKSL
jgi:hypothetical protein